LASVLGDHVGRTHFLPTPAALCRQLLLLSLDPVELEAYALDVTAPRKPSAPPPVPSGAHDVSRIEHDNLEGAVRDHRRRLERIEHRMDDVAREVAAPSKQLRSMTGTP
jgi:hypothetical protein